MVRGQMGETGISYWGLRYEYSTGYDRLRVSRGWQGEEINTESLWWNLLENGHL